MQHCINIPLFKKMVQNLLKLANFLSSLIWCWNGLCQSQESPQPNLIKVVKSAQVQLTFCLWTTWAQVTRTFPLCSDIQTFENQSLRFGLPLANWPQESLAEFIWSHLSIAKVSSYFGKQTEVAITSDKFLHRNNTRFYVCNEKLTVISSS